MKKFGASEFRTIRAVIYLIFGLSAGLPVLHYYFFCEDYVDISHWSMLSFGVYYVIGAIIYAMRFPERFFPGKFDVWFHSHQIFHVLIVIAAWIHLNNIQEIAFLRILQQNKNAVTTEGIPKVLFPWHEGRRDLWRKESTGDNDKRDTFSFMCLSTSSGRKLNQRRRSLEERRQD